MAAAEENTNCPLYGTEYCRLLNMRSCAQCTVKDCENFDELKRDIAVYERLLPEGGVAHLFMDPACQFCKGHKGSRHGYAILDMAHPEPKRIQKRLIGKRVAAFGTMIPLQFGICNACRKRFLAMEYLPTVLPLTVGVLGLVAIGVLDGGQSAMGVGVPLAFLIWLGAVILAMLAGRFLSRALEKRYEAEMCTNVLKQPVVEEMVELGWTPVARQSRTKLMFSKTRLSRGLGTAPDAGFEKE